MKCFFLSFFIFVSVFTILPYQAFAQTDYQNCMITSANPDSDCRCAPGNPYGNEPGSISCYFKPADFFKDPSSIINVLLPNLILIAGIILFLLVIFAGFQMITSAGSGDAKAVEKWRNMLMYGIAGFVIVLFAYTSIKLIEYFTGANILNPEDVLNRKP